MRLSTSLQKNQLTGTAKTGLSFSFPINVYPSRLTIPLWGVFWESTIMQSTNRVTERLLTFSKMLCHWELKRNGRKGKTAVSRVLFNVVKVNSRESDSPFSLTASCSSPFKSSICQIFQFLVTVLPFIRKTVTNANSTGSPRGYADLKHGREIVTYLVHISLW